MTDANLVPTVVAWYDRHRRDLPWRAADRTPWGVLVSEVMLQQTPVVRVLPAWSEWLRRWPRPAGLAEEEPAEAIRQWGRLGYPRRALNLHRAAAAIVARPGGEVPAEEPALRELPGVGEYTAAAVRAFAFGRRAVVLDTNVRRVLARAVVGTEQAAPGITAAERATAAGLLPLDDAEAARWSVAAMELGAMVCTARNPACERCPVLDRCAWVAAGRPPHEGPARRVQRFAGTDRQVRGRLMAVLRATDRPVAKTALDVVWPDPVQRDRALDGLLADGLVCRVGEERFALPAR